MWIVIRQKPSIKLIKDHSFVKFELGEPMLNASIRSQFHLILHAAGYLRIFDLATSAVSLYSSLAIMESTSEGEYRTLYIYIYSNGCSSFSVPVSTQVSTTIATCYNVQG